MKTKRTARLIVASHSRRNRAVERATTMRGAKSYLAIVLYDVFPGAIKLIAGSCEAERWEEELPGGELIAIWPSYYYDVFPGAIKQ